jgi:hypothetical protein
VVCWRGLTEPLGMNDGLGDRLGLHRQEIWLPSPDSHRLQPPSPAFLLGEDLLRLLKSFRPRSLEADKKSMSGLVPRHLATRRGAMQPVVPGLSSAHGSPEGVAPRWTGLKSFQR